MSFSPSALHPMAPLSPGCCSAPIDLRLNLPSKDRRGPGNRSRRVLRCASHTPYTHTPDTPLLKSQLSHLKEITQTRQHYDSKMSSYLHNLTCGLFCLNWLKHKNHVELCKLSPSQNINQKWDFYSLCCLFDHLISAESLNSCRGRCQSFP